MTPRFRSDRRGLSFIGVLIGLVLIVVGLALLVSTGAFAYFGVAGLFNGTFVEYAVANALGFVLIIAGFIVAWWV